MRVIPAARRKSRSRMSCQARTGTKPECAHLQQRTRRELKRKLGRDRSLAPKETSSQKLPQSFQKMVKPKWQPAMSKHPRPLPQRIRNLEVRQNSQQLLKWSSRFGVGSLRHNFGRARSLSHGGCSGQVKANTC